MKKVGLMLKFLLFSVVLGLMISSVCNGGSLLGIGSGNQGNAGTSG